MGGIYIQDNRPMRRPFPNFFQKMEEEMEARRVEFKKTFDTMLDDISSFMEEHPEKVKVNVYGPLGDMIKKLQDKIERIEQVVIPKRFYTKEPTKVTVRLTVDRL